MKNQFNYCTLFDHNYLPQGVALINSIIKYRSGQVSIYVLAMDEITEQLLLTYFPANTLVVINLNEFENDQLRNLKKERNVAEYCWTLTPCLLKFCIEQYQLQSCVYLDSDCFFFSDPNQLYNEFINHGSVLITKHNFFPKHDISHLVGVFCVQYIGFKNNIEGLNALNWWQASCLEWCYAKMVDGKFGDQKYLDDWKERFPDVYIPKDFGFGVAPWNIESFNIRTENSNILLTDKLSKKATVLNFYHFHSFKIYSNMLSLADHIYFISPSFKKLVYEPYVTELKIIINKLNCNINHQNIIKLKFNIYKDFFISMIRCLLQNKINNNIIKNG